MGCEDRRRIRSPGTLQYGPIQAGGACGGKNSPGEEAGRNAEGQRWLRREVRSDD